MQWFKHSKDFRNTPAIKLMERMYGAAGYAYALKLLELIADVAGRRKPFNPTLKLEPPFDWPWLAMELGIFDKDEHGHDDVRFPSVAGAVEVIRALEQARFVEIEQTGKWYYKKRNHKPPFDEQTIEEERPLVITVRGMKQWAEWHDLDNRNRKKKSGDDGGDGVRFSGMGTPQ